MRDVQSIKKTYLRPEKDYETNSRTEHGTCDCEEIIGEPALERGGQKRTFSKLDTTQDTEWRKKDDAKRDCQLSCQVGGQDSCMSTGMLEAGNIEHSQNRTDIEPMCVSTTL